MRTRFLFVLLPCVAAVFCAASVSFAADPNPFQMIAGAGPVDSMSGASPMRPHGGGANGDRERPTPEAMIEKFGAELDLDGQQRMDLQIIAADYQPRLHDLTKIGQRIARDLMSTAPDAENYGDESDAASAAAASVTAEFVTLLAEMRGKLYAVLTPEQRDRFKALAAERREEMRAKMEQKKSAAGQPSE